MTPLIKIQNSKGGLPRTQRVQNLIDHFMDYYGSKDIAEIAEIFQVDKSTVYNNLHIIAEKNGMTREELLVYPNMSNSKDSKANPFRKEIIDFKNLSKDFDEIDSLITEIISEINKILEEKQC